MKDYRPAKKRVAVSVGESVRPSNNAFERSGNHRGPRLAAASHRGWPLNSIVSSHNRCLMRLCRCFGSLAIALMALLNVAGASAQQSFQLSSKFYEMQFVRGKPWTGQHSFNNIFCLTFPRAPEASALAEAMYNNNSLYFSRVEYTDLTALHVVASTVPPGRSVEVEINNLASQNQKSVDAHPATFAQSRITGLLGPSLKLTVRNATEGGKESPYPFVRPFVVRPDGRLASLSIHRLFVHDRDRIEVAGLRFFKTPVESDREASAISELSQLVEAAADSLQSCTAKLPSRQ